MSEEDRFAFGKNWQAFLAALSDDRIAQAVTSLQTTLGTESLEGKRFLDLGCGSGLFSLAAQRLGAEVVAIDFDADSVVCSEELRQRFGSETPTWEIRQGSVLDASLMQSLGKADVVYSWGVLHHTGDMDRAIALAAERTKPGGLFMLAIYNDQGGASRRWLAIKKIYNRIPSALRPFWVVTIAGIYEAKFALARLARFRNPLPFADWRSKKKDRGMSAWHDWVDWIGGMPFEVATPEQIIVPLRKQGFVLENLKTVGSGWGCNEFVFSKPSATPSS
jgi:2-polyprenyl-6-hydroxyphenyl methylase/3-demethylubiquinone-9 3-methyltransferase